MTKGLMTPTIFRGLCIGGPCDGVIREAKHDWFLAAKLIDGRLVEVGPGDPHKALVSKTYKYEYIELTASGHPFGFWVRSGYDVDAMDYIMRHLITSYERKEGSK